MYVKSYLLLFRGRWTSVSGSTAQEIIVVSFMSPRSYNSIEYFTWFPAIRVDYEPTCSLLQESVKQEDNLCIRIYAKMIQLSHWRCNDKWPRHAVEFTTFPGWLSLRLWGLIWNEGPMSDHGSPVTVLKSRMAPMLILWISCGSKNREPSCKNLEGARASHSHRMWGEISSPISHLHSGLSTSPRRWRCLLGVLCPVRRPVTALAWVLLKDKNFSLAPRLGHEINSWDCLGVSPRPRRLAHCWLTFCWLTFWRRNYFFKF